MEHRVLRSVRVGLGFAPRAVTPGRPMPPPARRVRARLRAGVAAAVAGRRARPRTLLAAPPATASAGLAATAAATGPDLAQGSAYLVAPANLIHGHYYESFPGYADFGLTIDGALRAGRDRRPGLRAAGRSSRSSTAAARTRTEARSTPGPASAPGTPAAAPSATRRCWPRSPATTRGDFGGHNLIAALNASVCARRLGRQQRQLCRRPATTPTPARCSTRRSASWPRCARARRARRPRRSRYLESLQNRDGSFPSLIPSTGDQDVDSTAMAAMALALAPGTAAAADVRSGLAWIASRQENDRRVPRDGR